MLELPSLLLAALPLSQTYVMSACPWGLICTVSHSLQHILSGLRWTARNSGRKSRYSAWRREGGGCGVFQGLVRLCWHPVRLCYQLQLGIRGYSRGILGCGRGGIDLAGKYMNKMCNWFVLSVQGCYSFMVYIRVFILLWNMFFISVKFQLE